jgi:hypothetical protein
VQIDGIEGFKNYLHDGHKFIYDNIHIGNAIDVLPTLGSYDVIFFGDIIEHFSMEQGKILIRAAIERSKKCVILTTPRYDTSQPDLCDNPLERHQSVWGPKDFHSLGKCLVALADKGTYVVAYPTFPEKHLKLEIKQYGQPGSFLVRTLKNWLRPVKKYVVKRIFG